MRQSCPLYLLALYALLLSGIFLLPNHFPLMHAFALERKGFLSIGKNNSKEMMNQDEEEEEAWNFLKSTYYIISSQRIKNKEQSLFVRRMTVITDC